VNVMQLLHNVCDLQESIDSHEWQHVLCRSREFVQDHTNNKEAMIADAATPAAQQNTDAFCESFE